ncbi:nucleoside-diphosphate kinase [Candidatus Uhrbacteria bacterium RIFCSPHIGHO2_12_FULL_57_11]|uniref:nucleoside-diphosphate kinase n=2 Tax=Candidatus Uhriibacteriota TaxID=1752732 RepID=A0A1F7UN87_9BACT|nr:MAG: nucleoside-diphosphate kinase [Candidatus Uhrbacteria bacterium RIFCSPHIGHO2_02_FULL_57_19]OGL79157.1 MAG: nucleoside-diphosphate kinase [Candidatus Uhrbacteria bacterium RIFCSPHIGHO2_12_FULL_57_11]
MSSQTQSERTYFMIKPDGVTRGLIGEIIHRVEQRGLKIIALQMVQPTKAQMDEHYPKDEAWITRIGGKTLSTNEKYHIDTMAQMGTTDPFEIGKRVRGWLIDFMASAPVVKVVVEGPHAIEMIRKLAGNTMPALAEMGTIRGDYSVDSAATANREGRAVQNLVHASETPEEAAHEISHWFAPEDVHPYRRTGE